jgi:L-2-hydroxycarboxylate dehydrogenase (NAD+)
MPLIAATEARRVGLEVLRGCGVPETHAEVQIDLLLDAELAGRPSHGLLRLHRIAERIRNGVTNPFTTGTRRWRSSAVLDVDGEMGLGPVVAMAAVNEASARAEETGVALAAIHNNNHLGMLGWYVEQIASRGQIGIALCTTEPLVHPWGGRRAMVGTNPIAIGVPANPAPFVLDLATGIVSMGQIYDYAHRGRPIPPNWALDADGHPTTDAAAAKDGAITPFGDAKGYALGLAFEVLVAALTGSAIGRVRGTLDSDRVCEKGDVFIVVNPVEPGYMVDAVTEYLDHVRACPPTEGSDGPRIPGDRSRESRAGRLAHGIPIADDVWRDLVGLAQHEAHQG